MKIKRIITLTALAFAFSNSNFSQVGIGTTTPHASAELDVTSTSKGFLLPRMTTAQRDLISSPAAGLVIYNTTTSKAEVNVGSSVAPIWQATSGALPIGTSGQTLRHDGTNWVANSTIINNGTNVGIGTTSPVSNLDIQGSLGYKVNTITVATTLNQTHNVVLCNTGPYTVTLPAAASNNGKVYYIKNIDAEGDDITIDGNASETIDGGLTFLLDPYKHAVRIVSDGASWHVLEEAGQLSNNNNSFTPINCNGTIFTWNNVTSSTGKVWMDRNLGAGQVATSMYDANAYGDLYQWGRAKDGHQCRTSPTTTVLSKDNTPGHGKFIISTNWRSPTNANLWQGVNGINNPCPSGYRLPTMAEWNAESATWSDTGLPGAFASILKLTGGGHRRAYDGACGHCNSAGWNWSSVYNQRISLWGGDHDQNSPGISAGRSVRCIMD
jgi:hypothetical protein